MSSNENLVAFLRAEGAGEQPHAGGRTLLDHLMETSRIMRRWDQPGWLQNAALIHSVYGTEAYRREVVSLARRREIAAAAGERAERLAYLFHVTPRRPLFAGTHRWARELPRRPSRGGSGADDGAPPTRDEFDALVLLHMANIAEQARAADGSPARWLARIRALAELLLDSDSVTPPLFTARLAAFGEAEETITLRAFRQAAHQAGEKLALVAALCPVVPEPCVWLAHDARLRGDADSAGAWTAQARERLELLGTPWDKRLSFEEWRTLLDALDQPPDADPQRAPGRLTHPRALLESLASDRPTARLVARAPEDNEAGRRRFQRYTERLTSGDGRPGAVYPGLPSRPWHDPHDFPIVGELESCFETIRDELLALDGRRFHRESERIARTGDWDVAFLYERGRRHDDVCAVCPVTARVVETYPAVRTLAGLIYASRMRPGTHIAAHRGPTNLRVRCHLGIEVPEGDCAIRVADQTRRWEEGRCLVFDDYFVHEAWNHTDQNRIVLIVDLWHPALSDIEVRLLEGLHGYTYFHANRLSRYWSANARAAREGA